MPSIRKKRGAVMKKELHEEMSTHALIKMAEEVRRLIDGGMPRPEAEKKVFGKFFKKHQR